MNPEDEVCLCFHVTCRKIVNFIRVEKPVRVSQISECLGAGTGCGWCRPVLKKMFDQAPREILEDSVAGEFRIPGFHDLSKADYVRQRKQHIADSRQSDPQQADQSDENA